jgi:glycosyltransferase involved in cell wall biosynthesis
MAGDMRIAFVSTVLGYPWGGADTLWTAAAEAAARRGDALFLAVSPAVAAHPRIAALQRGGAMVHERAPASGPASLGARLARKLQVLMPQRDDLLGALDAFRPDLVIFSLGGTYDLVLHPAWFEWLRARRTKFRVIANWQEENPLLPETDRDLARALFAEADAVNFVSTRNRDVTRRHLLEPLPRARVTQNPLRWQPGDVSPWPASPPWRLATVSRLDEGKGIQLLLHAAAAVLANQRDWQLNLYGEGPAESYLRATVAHLGLGERVQFRGYVRELRAIWAENHLMISPSLEDGVPMTIPEAMLCARPVLATNVGGAEDWISPGTGFLCPAPTLPLLSTALRAAFDARDRWPAMGAAGAEAARAHYRPDDYLTLIAPPAG